jgi:hypothetical protein
MRLGPTAAILLLASYARAEDKATKFALPGMAPYGLVSFENQKGQVEAGIELNFGPGVLHDIPEAPNPNPGSSRVQSLRLFADVPFQSDDSTVGRLDYRITTWALGSNLAFERTTWNIDSNDKSFQRLRLGLEGKFTANSYDFYRDGGPTKSTEWHEGYSMKLKSLYHVSHGDGHWAPQLELGYVRPYKAADKVPVVSAPAAGVTVIGKNEIVDPPSAMATAYARASLLALGGRNYGAGISFLYTLTGEKNRISPVDGSQRLQIELWGYYFPIYPPERKTVNLRVGVAPFVNVLTSGSDTLNHTFFGALVELRASTTELEY